jgi:hypothetical protein
MILAYMCRHVSSIIARRAFLECKLPVFQPNIINSDEEMGPTRTRWRQANWVKSHNSRSSSTRALSARDADARSSNRAVRLTHPADAAKDTRQAKEPAPPVLHSTVVSEVPAPVSANSGQVHTANPQRSCEESIDSLQADVVNKSLTAAGTRTSQRDAHESSRLLINCDFFTSHGHDLCSCPCRRYRKFDTSHVLGSYRSSESQSQRVTVWPSQNPAATKLEYGSPRENYGTSSCTHALLAEDASN